ncbi:ABC transporter permease [Paenarthrobacter sp. NPDC057981]|uniref:ABC transporter permease n=1 Tax=Paenarthrobacter sp. NPDC057981 TaxID=3346297 RepID=UPI0036DC15A1
MITAFEKATDRVSPRERLARQFGPTGLALTVAIALFFLGGLIAPGFTTPRQIASILTITTLLALISLGQTLVVMSGGEGIDLSVGALVTLSAITGAAVMNSQSESTVNGIVAAVVVCAAVGALTGVGIVLLKLPPLIVTLAMSGVLGGISLVLTNGRPPGGPSPALIDFVQQPILLGLPAVTYAVLALAVVVGFVLTRTRFGKQLLSVGANRAAARWAGIGVNPTVVLTYCLSGIAGGLGGIVLAGYAGSVSISIGSQYTLLSIAAVVIGGTALTGGTGSFWGTVSGALMLTVLTALLTAIDLTPAMRQVCYGLIFLAMVLLYGRQKSLRL